MAGSPELITIDHDKYHAEFVGRCTDGRQFFLTTPFVLAADGRIGSEFIALYTFDPQGNLLEAKIQDFGPRASLNHEERFRLRDQWLSELGEKKFDRIEVRPFELDRFGETFGLVIRVPEEDDDVWAVEVQPGNYMAFFEPWDSGEYDT